MISRTVTTHPKPAISLTHGSYDPLDVIAAGIGGPLVQDAARSFSERDEIAAEIVAAATGYGVLYASRRRQDDPPDDPLLCDQIMKLRNRVADILESMPDSLWVRVETLLTDCEPVDAFRIIALYHTTCLTLTNGPIPVSLTPSYVGLSAAAD